MPRRARQAGCLLLADALQQLKQLANYFSAGTVSVVDTDVSLAACLVGLGAECGGVVSARKTMGYYVPLPGGMRLGGLGNRQGKRHLWAH